MTQLGGERRYDLDWLRCLAFVLLIFYHTGMLYVQNWDFHYKSQYLSPGLEYLMLLVSPWRMSLIWLIAGFALAALLQRCCCWSDVLQLLLRRSLFLLLPLLVGLWLIVPPQLYAEMVQKEGITLTYWQFYQAFWVAEHPLFTNFQSGVWPHVDVNHLWFLRSLWYFTLGLLLLSPLLNLACVQRWIQRLLSLHLAWMIIGMSVLLLANRLWQDSDAERDGQGLLFMVLGFVLVRQPIFWQQLPQHRIWLGWCCSVNACLICLGYAWLDKSGIGLYALSFCYGMQAILGVCWLLALAQQYLNRPHPWLAPANQIVFPVYLLHQSILIVAALWLAPWQLGPLLEPLCVLLLTIGGCACFVALFWYLPPWLRWLGLGVGLRTSRAIQPQWPPSLQRLGYAAGLLLVLPLAYELLY